MRGCWAGGGGATSQCSSFIGSRHGSRRSSMTTSECAGWSVGVGRRRQTRELDYVRTPSTHSHATQRYTATLARLRDRRVHGRGCRELGRLAVGGGQQPMEGGSRYQSKSTRGYQQPIPGPDLHPCYHCRRRIGSMVTHHPKNDHGPASRMDCLRRRRPIHRYHHHHHPILISYISVCRYGV